MADCGERDCERGFSLLEILIALLLTMVVMTSVFLLLQKGQQSFRREPEISDMNTSARSGLDRISQDLAVAGFNTPPNLAVLWADGGGLNPDGVTVLYADPDIPISRPLPCVSDGAPCNTVGSAAVLHLDPGTFSPRPPDFELVYLEGMVLFALQGPNGNPACDAVAPGLASFLVTSPPKCSGGGGKSGPAACGTLDVSFDRGLGAAGIEAPGGFDNDVSLDCAIVGAYHVVQYRVNPPPPSASPSLERRDASVGEPWTPVASNIENLQVQYAQGVGDGFVDEPALMPMGSDPGSWITRVRITVGGRSASENLQGATQGVYAAGDTHLRRSFTTTMSLRNQLTQAEQKAFDLGLPGWN
jgi:Prokaryotic N-terminal methylation motif